MQKAKPRVSIQVRVSPESKRFFDCYCAMAVRSQSVVLELLINNLAQNWRARLGPEGWQRFLKEEITLIEAKEIYRAPPDQTVGIAP